MQCDSHIIPFRMPLATATLGPYEIIVALGSGGMGEVYRARDTRLHRQVAIKVLAPHVAGDPLMAARFDREVRAVAALSHPNIVGIFDVGEHAGMLFVVTELLDGETLRQYLVKGALPYPQDRNPLSRQPTPPSQLPLATHWHPGVWSRCHTIRVILPGVSSNPRHPANSTIQQHPSSLERARATSHGEGGVEDMPIKPGFWRPGLNAAVSVGV